MIDIPILSGTFLVGSFLLGAVFAATISYLLNQRRISSHKAEAVVASGELNQQITGLQQELQAAQILIAQTEAEFAASVRLGEAQEIQAKVLAEKNDHQAAEITSHRERISQLETTLTEQQKQTEEKLALLQEAKAQMNIEFKSMANDIFDAKQKRFSEQSQAQLDGILKPLGERIQAFEKKVEDSYATEAKERFSLIKEVKNLQELNARISKDAINLTNALK